MTEYRVKEAVVLCLGVRDVRRRMFIAERRVSVLGLFSFWWPCDGGWRYTQDEAKRDVERDAYLGQPLDDPIYMTAPPPPKPIR